MPKSIRKTADYFKKLPDADPMADKPTDNGRVEDGARAVKALLPGWATNPVDTADDGTKTFPTLPDGENWAHLVDTGDDNAEDEVDGEGKAGGRRGWLKTLVAERSEDKVESPAAVIEDAGIRMNKTKWHTVVDDWTDPKQRLRKVGLQLATNAEGAAAPVFQRTKAEGMVANDYPLPGTSFAVMGVRGSFGRQEVATAKVEADRLFYDKKDTRHGGVPDLRSAPLTANVARKMKPGERYKVTTERSVLAESGLKYTPTPLPGVTSSMFHDLGPSAAIDFTVAVEGETSIEVVRGFGTKVAVAISARDERATPGKDKTWRASLGAFVDGSLVEYVAQSFGKLASGNVEREVGKIEDRKREMDQKIMPYTDAANRYSAAAAQKRTKESTSQVTLYEVVFDLSNKNARKTFDKLIGARRTVERSVDFSALANLPEDSGVQLVANNVKTASAKGIERTFSAFGFEAHTAQVTEKSETRRGTEGKTRVLQEKHGLVRRTKKPGRTTNSTTIGRVKTVKDTDEAKTGVGFGWRYSVDDAHTDVEALSELLGFAAFANDDPISQARLQRLHDTAAELPRRKLLGLPIGKRGIGETKAEFALELNVDAVKRLLTHFDDDAGRQELWGLLAAAYASRQHLEEVPKWPIPGLMGEGAMAAVKEKLFTFGDEASSFCVARTAMRVLEAAHEASDPVAASKMLAKSFDALRNDLHFAGALVQASRGADGTGTEVDFVFDGAERLDAPAAAEAPAGAAPSPS